MTQFALFEAALSLLDGERGRVTYQPGFVCADLAERYFAQLRDGVDWHSQRRVMYEREVDVPRLTAHFALDEWVPHGEPEGLTRSARTAIEDVAGRVTRALGVPFNSIGLNLYRDGSDSVAPHNDRLNDLVEGQPIALISLGATRRMLIRSKQAGEAAVPIDLEGGSMLVMSWQSQLHYTHGVAKTKAAVGPRISLALRVRPRS